MTDTKRRNRRSPEQIIVDLEAEIQRVRERAAKRAAKAAPEGKAFLTAVKALDKAIAAAAQQDNDELEQVLQASRDPLSERLDEMGFKMRVAVALKRRGRKAEASEDITPVLDSVGAAIKRTDRARA